MTVSDPRVGETHDLVFWVNNSIKMGAIAAPLSYRVSIPPGFVPTFAVGDPKGVDRTRWKSWIQDRFDGGAGQIYFKGSNGNNRFAESNLVDIGLPSTVAIGQAGGYDPTIAVAAIGQDLADSPQGDIRAAVVPRATTPDSVNMGTLFSNENKVFMLSMSNRPHMYHWLSAHLYTNLSGSEDPFKDGSLRGSHDALKGVWAAVNTNLGAPVLSAVQYSASHILSIGDTMLVHGKEGTAGHEAAASIHVPGYSTGADILAKYDKKLWRTEKGQAAFFDPAQRIWSDYTDVGDPQVDVNNTVVAFGKLYFGKEDSLQVFDGGRIYEVENYEDEQDPNNFNLMVVHKGALYYNIKGRVFRLTSGNLIEELNMPRIAGVVKDGTSVGNELHILYEHPSGEGRVFIFDAETGGTRQWFQTEDLSFRLRTADRAPASILSALGYLWMAPMDMSLSYSSQNSIPVAAVNRAVPPTDANLPYFAESHAYFITSMLSLGYDNLNKVINSVVTDYNLNNSGERIDVYYTTELKTARPTAVKVYNDDTAAYTDGTDPMTNGSADPKDGTLDSPDADGYYYFTFDKPVRAVRIVVDEGSAEPTGAEEQWEYSLGGGLWRKAWGFYGDSAQITDETDGLKESGTVYLGKLPSWAQDTVDGKKGYHLRYRWSSSVATQATADFEEGDLTDVDASTPNTEVTKAQEGDFEEGDTSDMDDVVGESTLRTNLSSWWSMDEASGNRSDSHGTRTLTDNGSTGSATGKQSNSADFTPTDWFNVASDSELVMDDSMTFAFWFKIDDTSTGRYLFGKDAGGEYQVVYRNSPDDILWEVWVGGTKKDIVLVNGPSTDTWYFCVVWYDATNGEIGGAVDGGSATTESVASPDTGTHDFEIGDSTSGFTEWDGEIDEVGFWRGKVLSAAERTELYNSGNGIAYADTLSGIEVNGTAALEGSNGVEITVDTDDKYLEFTDPSAATEVTVRAYFDPNGLTMATDDVFTLIECVGEFKVEVAYDGTNYELRLTATTDTGSTVTSRYDITDAAHVVRAVWKASTGAGNDDGYALLFDDNELLEALTGLDTDTLSVDEVRYGAVDADAGTSGTIYVDGVWWSTTAQGPIVEATAAAALAGSFGARINVSSFEVSYIEITSPSNEIDARLTFLFDPDTIEMANSDEFELARAIGDAGPLTTTWKLWLKDDAGTYKVKLEVFNDSSGSSSTSYYALTDGSQTIRIDWDNNGEGLLYIDASLKETLSGIDNDQYDIDTFRIGGISGVDDTTYGNIYVDGISWGAGTGTVVLVEVGAIRDLRLQDWTLLGSITDLDSFKSSLAFSPRLVTDEIMLMYEIYGSDVSSPEIRKIEVEHMPVGQLDKKRIDLSVVAQDKMQILQQTDDEGKPYVENSAEFIQATMFSMAQSGIPHVVAIPYPAPRGQTIEAKVELVQPGVSFPVLAYQDSIANAEIPIRLEEV